MKELLTLIIQNIESFEKSVQFRKGQKPFYNAIIQGLKKGWETMYIEGPTGMGKTFIEAVIAAAIIGDSNIKVLLLTSKITLLQQIQREFKKFVGFLRTGLFGGGFKDHSQQVTIMTYDSFRNLDESIAKQYSVLLLDEGHKGLGEKTKAKLERQKKFSILIGFTASATYSAKKSLEDFLENLAYKLSIVKAVELGMLSNIKVMIASVDIEIESQRKGESKGDYEERISSEIIREGGNIATARLYKRVFAKRNLRGISLVLTMNQGNDLVEQFALEGIKAELIHSGMKRAERENMFSRFRNSEFTVLVGMGIIKEGFDDPGVSVAITTYPVSSIVDMTQFPGRAERIDEENPDKVAYIVNLAYKAKKQLFYTDILDGKSEVLQTKGCTEKLDITPNKKIKFKSLISKVAVSEKEIREIMRDIRGVEAYSEEEIIQEAKKELVKNGFQNRTSLVNSSPDHFTTLNFGIFGQGISFTNILLSSRSHNHITKETLSDIAKEVGWNDKFDIDLAIIELEKKGINSRLSLIHTGSIKFIKLDFGVYGKGHAFTRKVLNDSTFKQITIDVLERIAKKVGWNDELTIELALNELSKHGITDYYSLLNFGIAKFVKTEFGYFGKGKALTKWLIKEDFKNLNSEIFLRIPQRLNWDQKTKTLERALEELKNHGIVDRFSLINKPYFEKLDFGPFGKAKAFISWLLSDYSIKNYGVQTRERIAEKLGWNDKIKTLDRAREELAKHNITNKISLINIGSIQFSKLEFGPFGKGKGFANWMLHEDGNGNVTHDRLAKIAQKLEWKDELTFDLALIELANHGIYDKSSLINIGSTKFKKLKFGSFGVGKSIISFITKEPVYFVKNETLEELANKLDWK